MHLMLKGRVFIQGISTQMLNYAGNMIAKHVARKKACCIALVSPMTGV